MPSGDRAGDRSAGAVDVPCPRPSALASDYRSGRGSVSRPGRWTDLAADTGTPHPCCPAAVGPSRSAAGIGTPVQWQAGAGGPTPALPAAGAYLASSGRPLHPAVAAGGTAPGTAALAGSPLLTLTRGRTLHTSLAPLPLPPPSRPAFRLHIGLAAVRASSAVPRWVVTSQGALRRSAPAAAPTRSMTTLRQSDPGQCAETDGRPLPLPSKAPAHYNLTSTPLTATIYTSGPTNKTPSLKRRPCASAVVVVPVDVIAALSETVGPVWARRCDAHERRHTPAPRSPGPCRDRRASTVGSRRAVRDRPTPVPAGSCTETHRRAA